MSDIPGPDRLSGVIRSQQSGYLTDPLQSLRSVSSTTSTQNSLLILKQPTLHPFLSSVSLTYLRKVPLDQDRFPYPFPTGTPAFIPEGTSQRLPD